MQTKDDWLTEYEGIFDAFIADSAKDGEPQAIENARKKLKRLGFDRPEIQAQIAELPA